MSCRTGMGTNFSEMKNTETESACIEVQLHSNDEAAKILGVAPITMKVSRQTGTLLGKPAPEFLKMGRLIRYKNYVLVEWVEQFRSYNTTSQVKSNENSAI